jgi:hypothetical protein
VYLLIDLLEKINTKACFYLYNVVGQSKLHKGKVNYIKDAHNYGKNYFDHDFLKSFNTGPKIPKIWGKM